MRRPLPFDPIEEAGRQWERRWHEVEAMRAATSIMRVQQIVLARVDEALRPWDLSFARYELLVLLHFTKEGRLPLGKMGDRLMLHQASVTNLVDRLEHQGYVRREAHPTDRRTTLAVLTPAGRAIIEAATRAVVDARVGLTELSAADADRLNQILRTVRLGAADFDDDGADRGR
jgi:DNA-binding MarR family transcriptional regulator